MACIIAVWLLLPLLAVSRFLQYQQLYLDIISLTENFSSLWQFPNGTMNLEFSSEKYLNQAANHAKFMLADRKSEAVLPFLLFLILDV